MDDVRNELDALLNSARDYFKGIKEVAGTNISSLKNKDIIAVRGMCRVLLKIFTDIDRLTTDFPELMSMDIIELFEEFEYFNNIVANVFKERTKDVDSKSLEEILNSYKESIVFLENWLELVYEPTVDLFVHMKAEDINDYTIRLTFAHVSKHWHYKDILLGVCDDLRIYRTRLNEVSKKIEYLYRLVNTAKQSKA